MDNKTLIETIRQCVNGYSCDGCAFENAAECPSRGELALMASEALEAMLKGYQHGTNAI